jgi:hypothetical protein
MMSTNAIVTVLIIPAAVALVGAIKALWSLISKFLEKLNADLDECKEDRVKLFGKCDELQGQLLDVTREVRDIKRGQA